MKTYKNKRTIGRTVMEGGGELKIGRRQMIWAYVISNDRTMGNRVLIWNCHGKNHGQFIRSFPIAKIPTMANKTQKEIEIYILDNNQQEFLK
jgi:hypothetical protein|tara:strand:+ start:110 stop:385 length:276 start_codon:yes stop_codon:yes gene_type:complete